MAHTQHLLQPSLADPKRWVAIDALPVFQTHRHERTLFEIDDGPDSEGGNKLGSADCADWFDTIGSGSRIRSASGRSSNHCQLLRMFLSMNAVDGSTSRMEFGVGQDFLPVPRPSSAERIR
jgi:hypothetical protein